MDCLYPDIKPFNETTLAVSARHSIHFEQCGNPDGQPIVLVHGGPGGGIDPLYRRFFNPDHYHIILVDQRGSGKSTPHADIIDNTTQALIADFEKIREHLQLNAWILFGGSWGSTLSLAYAQAHPDNIQGLILRGIYLATEAENNWLFGGHGAHLVYPDYWQDFISIIPDDEHDNLIAAYYKKLTSNDEQQRRSAAHAWSRWEVSISKLNYDQAAVDAFLASPSGISMACLECHYMKNRCFLKPNQLLNNIDRIRHIPTAIVHGRYDMVCNVNNAWQLHQAMPQSELYIIPAAGHSMTENNIAKKLVALTDQWMT